MPDQNLQHNTIGQHRHWLVRLVRVLSEFHLKAALNDKARWECGELFYDGVTYYYIHAGKLVISLEGHLPSSNDG